MIKKVVNKTSDGVNPKGNVASFKQKNRLFGGTVTKSVHEGKDSKGKDYSLEMKTVRNKDGELKKRVMKMDGEKTVRKYNPGDYNPKSVKVIKKK
jgi:hypothetical protein